MAILLTVILLFLVFTAPALASEDFTDDELNKILELGTRTLFYSFSASMPLSLEGLAQIRSAASELDAQVVFLLDPSTQETEIHALPEVSEILLQFRYQKSETLRDKGIQLHYPSVAIADAGKVQAELIAGFKTGKAYVALIADALRLPYREEYQVLRTVSVPQHIGDFFKPVYGTDLVVVRMGGGAVFNLKTQQITTIPNDDWSDPGASPDGEFITLLGSDGLAWFTASDVLRGNATKFLKDPGLTTYQSMGLLSNNVHRVLGAQSSSTAPTGLIVRDYEKRSDTDGAIVVPMAGWRPVCSGKRISLPMLSKTGLLLSGQHEGTLRAFRIGEDGRECEQIFDTGRVTGKADFSIDDRFLVFVSRETSQSGQPAVDVVFLADIMTGSVETVYAGSEADQLVFPNFANSGRILVFEKRSQRLIVLEKTRIIQD